MRVYVTNYDRRKFVVSVSPTATVSELTIEAQNVYRRLYQRETRIAAFKTEDGYDICGNFRVADVLEDKCRLVTVQSGDAVAAPLMRALPLPLPLPPPCISLSLCLSLPSASHSPPLPLSPSLPPPLSPSTPLSRSQSDRVVQIIGKRTEEGLEAASAASTASVHAGTVGVGVRFCCGCLQGLRLPAATRSVADGVPGTPVDSPYARRLSIGSDTQVWFANPTWSISGLQIPRGACRTPHVAGCGLHVACNPACSLTAGWAQQYMPHARHRGRMPTSLPWQPAHHRRQSIGRRGPHRR